MVLSEWRKVFGRDARALTKHVYLVALQDPIPLVIKLVPSSTSIKDPGLVRGKAVATPKRMAPTRCH